MRISNTTRSTTLTTQARHATGFLARLRGLMLAPPLPEGGGLLLEPESSIHTFFMKYPIDVVYLSKDYRVLRVDKAMPPARLGPIYTRGCHAILELPAGVVTASHTAIGDILSIQP